MSYSLPFSQGPAEYYLTQKVLYVEQIFVERRNDNLWLFPVSSPICHKSRSPAGFSFPISPAFSFLSVVTVTTPSFIQQKVINSQQCTRHHSNC